MPIAREETSRLAELLRREHAAMADFLIALAEFDRRRLWVDLGHASLFAFLTRELRLSAGAAQYRKTAAELVQKHPEVEAALRDGRLCLSSVNELAKVVTAENASEILPRFFGLSARDAAFVAASIRPVEHPPRRDFLVTALPVPQGRQPLAADPATAATTTQSPFRTSEMDLAPEAVVAAAPLPDSVPVAPPPLRDRPNIRPLDSERARVSMTVSRRLLDKLAAARDALSHSHPGATEGAILEVGLDLILQRHAKRRGLVERPRKRAAAPDSPASTAEAAPAPRSRHIPAEVSRAVWKRDGGKCQWPLEGGGVCGSTHRVEIDHIDPFALGGPTTVERCRVLCDFHNDLAAREVFGSAHMDAFTRPKGGRCSEPVATYAATCGARRCGVDSIGRFRDRRGAVATSPPARRSPPRSSCRA